MKTDNLLSFFDTVIYRRPAYNIGAYLLIPHTQDEVSTFVHNLYLNPAFKNSIYIASPELYNLWVKMYDITFTLEESKKKKIENNIIKYYVRSIFNCSPFGLFSGYSILDKNENNQENKQIKYINHCFIQSVINEVNSIHSFRLLFKYTLNNTIYKVDQTLRYMEYNPQKCCYELSKIDIDPVIDYVYKSFKTPMSISDMAKLLFQKIAEVNYEDIVTYINNLIDSQFLISDFQILINGGSPSAQIKELVVNKKAIEDYLVSKYNIDLLYDISNKDYISTSQNIRSKFKLDDILKKQSVINVNLRIDTKLDYKNIIEKDKIKIQKLVSCLEKFVNRSPESFYLSETNIKMFTDEFQERYEEQELPLVEVLDPEVGIGYLNSDSLSKDIIPDLAYTNNFQNTEIEKVTFDSVNDRFFIKKVTDALLNGNDIINITTADLSSLGTAEQSYRGTYTLIYTKIKDKIAFFAGGGATAEHYIGRFTAFDNDLSNLSTSITNFENYVFKDKIVAEIIHLSNEECGNLINRNIRREYEIPIYSQHSKSSHPIYLNDILISVKNGKIILRSKKYNKEIIPFLSCAHNYHFQTAPIYKFLCDVQCQYRRNILSFDISSMIRNSFKYIPRFEYDNSIILSPSTWLFTKEDLKECIDLKGNIIFNEFKIFIQRYNIPRYIDLIENSYSLLVIDLENEYLFDIVNQSLNKFGQLYFQENLYLNECPDKDSYANQIVLSIYKDNPLPPQKLPTKTLKTKRCFVPGDEWLYFKIYCSHDFSTRILVDLYKIVTLLLKKQIIDKWFFIKLHDPGFHIRFRVHVTSIENMYQVFSLMNRSTKTYIKSGQISNINMSTYKRELERYYDTNITSVESIFCIDSEFVINVYNKIKTENSWGSLWLYGLRGIDGYLNSFGLNIHQKLSFVSGCYESYCNEFEANKVTRKQIDTLFRDKYKSIHNFLNSDDKDVITLYNYKENALKQPIMEIKSALSEEQTNSLIRSINHMFINRLLITKQRLNEMVLYGVLTKFYKKESWTA